GLSSASTLSFVGSSTAACISTLGLINARVIRFLGARRAALLGISLTGLGQVASVTPPQYFNKRRGLANGIVYDNAGGGLGGAVTSFAINALIKSVGPAWTFRTIGFVTLATGVPTACLIKERTTIRTAGFIEWLILFFEFSILFYFQVLVPRSRFIILFFAGAIGTFPLYAAPFFLPPYSNSVGLSESGVGVGLVEGSNFSSACTWPPVRFRPPSPAISSRHQHAMLAIRPVSTSLALLVLFVVVNGGSFSTMPTVRAVSVSVAMGIIIVTGWAGGYLMGAPIAGYVYLLNAYGGAESMYAEYSAYRPAPAMFYAGSMGMGWMDAIGLKV
ncbi:major facilitator superfamily transporter, partial [Mycena albidolilacea]